MKKLFCFLTMLVNFGVAIGVGSSGFSGMAVNSNPSMPNSAPITGMYTNSSGRYIGNTTTVNGGTTYFNNGKYQGQSPANSQIYYNNQQQKNELINQMPD